MKTTLSLILLFFMCTISAQTSTQLIGKWQLVKLTKNGKEKSIKEKFKSDQVFQVFTEDGKFTGIVGDRSTKGKWKLSKNNEVLTVIVDLISVKFQIEYFDSDKRIITNDQLGTLEYKKVN